MMGDQYAAACMHRGGATVRTDMNLINIRSVVVPVAACWSMNGSELCNAFWFRPAAIAWKAGQHSQVVMAR